MKRILWLCLLVLGLILSWSMVSAMELVGDAPVPETGQTTSYRPGDDGDLEKGAALPTPRFTDNNNGTVTDNLTGLIWMKNAHCEKFHWWDSSGQNERTWENAVSVCYLLSNGYCGLSDGSSFGDWRLPNARELHSLRDFGYYHPALSNAAGTGQWSEGDPFTGVQLDFSGYYWSSSTYAWYTSNAWVVLFDTGGTNTDVKSEGYYVWCVRGGN